MHEGALVLKEALTLYLTITRKLEKLYTYAHLRHDEEITIDAHTSNFQKVTSTLHDFREESAWFEPELLSLSEERIDEYLKGDELSEYRFYIEKVIRNKPHTLSAEKEALLAMSAQPMQASAQAFSALNNADLTFNPITDEKGQEHPLSHALYSIYLRSPDRTLRKHAFQAMHKSFHNVENTISELLSGTVKTHHFHAKARAFPSCMEAALFPHNIPPSVYRSLIQTVRSNLPKLHHYVNVRKKLLAVDELHLYDMYVPLVEDVAFDFSYAEAEELVIQSVAPLGTKYQQTLQKGLQEELWVDRFENKNKRSGAYSSGCYDSYPYILMNYNRTMRDVFTLAHEAGHSMHSLLSKTAQPYHYADYPIFVAEVASTFNEELLMDLLLKTRTNEQERRFLVNERLENMRATLFRQTMFAEFELLIHEFVENKVPLTPNLLKEHYLKLNQEYFGPDVIIDQEIAIEWARIPHFYYNFYVYQYATGISAAITLAKAVLAGDKEKTANYLSFLEGGCSLFPIDLLKLAGIDLTSTEPFNTACELFEAQTALLEK